MEKGQLERQHHKLGQRIVGVDEVGRGCIAGPVYAAAVVLDYEALFTLPASRLRLIRDSKTLSTAQRQKIIPLIHELACAQAIGISTVDQIETMGIVPATFAAMHQALGKIHGSYDLLLIDGRARLPDFDGDQHCLIKGDSLAYAIAAASILAKEARDQYMRDADTQYPAFGFAQHVGYGTKKHLQALQDFGICPLHRRNFAPVSKYEKQHASASRA